MNPDRISLDLSIFDKLIQVQGKTPVQQLEHLLQAEKLYKGHLLEEYPYEAYLEPVRERVKQSYLKVLWEIGMICWNKEEYNQGIHYFDKVLESDKYAEPKYWEYIQILLKQGFVQNAKTVSMQMIKNLEQEMGISVKERLFLRYPEISL